MKQPKIQGMTRKKPVHSLVTLHCKVSQTLILIRRKTSMQAEDKKQQKTWGQDEGNREKIKLESFQKGQRIWNKIEK